MVATRTTRTALLAIDVMTAVDTKQPPAVLLQDTAQLLSAHRFHTAISTTLVPAPAEGGAMSTDKQPSTAS